MLITPRWYQQEAINSIFEYFAAKQGNPLIALPTASGKTIVIAGFIYQVLQHWPAQRFIVGTHVKELIEQNARKLNEAWPHAPYGIYSAGLKSRDFMQPIIFGGIASMCKDPKIFGHRDLLIIDEAHLVSPKEGSIYQEFIIGLRKTNPHLKVIGLTATKYRQGIGYITDPHEGRIFTDICYDMTDIAGIGRLIAEGFLSPLFPRPTAVEIDVSGVGMHNGEFNQKALQAAADKERITYAALQEAMRYGQNRQSWLAFCSGIEHSEHVADMLRQFGINAAVVHSKTNDEDRTKRVNAHKSGELRCLVGNNVFTTGYDHPPLDFIIDLQPTMSTSKHVQKYGRGMRIFDGNLTFGPKNDCIILDFGGNTRRLGPINDPVIPKLKGEATGEAPVKICEVCGVYNHTSARFCISCGEEFALKVKFTKASGEDEIIRTDLPIVETYQVQSVFYYKHQSKTKPWPSLRVSYQVKENFRRFDEYVNFENPKARHFAKEWWRRRHAAEPPHSVDEALTMVATLRVPVSIKVWINRKWPDILSVEF